MEASMEAQKGCDLLEVFLAGVYFPLMRWLVLNEAFLEVFLEVFLVHHQYGHSADYYY